MTQEDSEAGTAQEGKSERRRGALRILQNFGFLTAGKTLGDVFTFFLYVTLSRAFGQEGIGQYAFAMALTGFFAVLASFGFYNFTIKELSRRTGPLGVHYSEVFSLRLLLSAATFTALLLTLLILPFPNETKLIIALIGASQVFHTLVNGFVAVFVAHESMRVAGLFEVSFRATSSVGAIAVCLAGGDLPMAVAVLPVAAFGHLVAAYALVIRKHGRPRFVRSRSSLRAVLRRASPYALSELIGQVHWRTDVVLLGFFLGAAATGAYSVPYQIVYLLSSVPYFAGMAIFPVASRLYKESSATLEALYRTALNLAILVGLPAAVGLCLIAPDLIDLVVGQSFSDSVPLLRLLAALLFIESLQSIVTFLLTACDRQVKVTRSQWTATWVNVLGNLILIPTMGIMGAVVAAVTSEALLLILLERQLRKVLGWPQVGSRLAMSSVATASFCLPFAFIPPLPMGITIPACMLLYSGTLVLFKEIRRNEVPTLRNLIKGESP